MPDQHDEDAVVGAGAIADRGNRGLERGLVGAPVGLGVRRRVEPDDALARDAGGKRGVAQLHRVTGELLAIGVVAADAARDQQVMLDRERRQRGEPQQRGEQRAHQASPRRRR